MIKTGLVSISFRQLSPEKIVEVVSKAGLDGIEWGGDIHVPHGNIHEARRVRRLTTDAGLEIVAYGSYYKLGQKDLAFETVLETAVELGCDLVRVWAGNISSSKADEKYWASVIDDSIRICELSIKANKIIALEYHANSLTDTKESARKLLDAISVSNFQTLWQPAHDTSVTQNIERLNDIKDKLANIHVFHWIPGYQRHLLQDGFHQWIQYFNIIKSTNIDRYALLEFFMDDSIDNLFKDSVTLKKMIVGE